MLLEVVTKAQINCKTFFLESFDFDVAVETLKKLKEGKSVEVISCLFSQFFTLYLLNR